MKKLSLTLFLLAYPLFSSADEIPWRDSPFNPRNASSRFENSSFSQRNSPLAWSNSIDNPSRLNIVGTLGNVIGYAVTKADGTINFFDNNGVRLGYSTDGGKTAYDNDGKSTSFTLKLNTKD